MENQEEKQKPSQKAPLNQIKDGKISFPKRPNGVKMNKVTRELMKEKIWEAELAGFSPTQTIKELNTTSPTYCKLLKQKVAEVEKTALSNSKQLLTKYFTRQEKALMRSLAFSEQIDDPKSKAELELKRAHAMTEAAQFIQSTGLMPKAADKLNMQAEHTFNAKFQVPDEFKKKKRIETNDETNLG